MEDKGQHNNQLGQARGVRVRTETWRVGGNDRVQCSNRYLIFLFFIFGPSPSSSIPLPSAFAFDAGHRCRCCCHHCHCHPCHLCHCNCPQVCHCAGVCVATPFCLFVMPAGCCLLLCLCCWYLCHASLFKLIVVFAAVVPRWCRR